MTKYKDLIPYAFLIAFLPGPLLGAAETQVLSPDGAVRFRVSLDEPRPSPPPAGSTVWTHDLHGHYEAQHEEKDVADVAADAWAAPPLTFRLPDGNGYASITEAALINYSGMALQADGRRGFAVR